MPTDDRPRILFITSNFPRWQGDSTTPFVQHLAQDLIAFGWAIDVLAPHAAGAMLVETMGDVRVERFRYLRPSSTQTVCYGGGALANLEHNRVNLVKLPFLVGAELWAVARRLSTRRYALAHSHWMLPQGFNTAIAARLSQVPHVMTVHGSDVLSLKGRAMRPFKRAALRGADVVTVNSSATEHEVCQLGVSPIVLERIPMGVGEPNLSKEQRRRSADIRLRYRRSSGPLLLFVGRFAEEKGWRDLITAIALLRGAGSDAVLLMLGDGPDRPDAVQLASEVGVADRVYFNGWVEHGEIATYLDAADIFVAPSCTTSTGRSEAQGLSLAEAMMSGRPVLTTRVGGIGDFVRHGETGWLVSERRPEELALAVRRLHADEELAARLGANARLYASRHLSREQTAQSFDRIYTRLTSRQRRDAVVSGSTGRVAAGSRPSPTRTAPGETPGGAVRILVVRHRPGAEAAYGGPVYTGSVMKLLAGGPLRAAMSEISFEHPPSRPVQLLRNLWAALRSLMSPLPAKVLRFKSGHFEHRLSRLLDADRFDLVVVSGLEMLWCRQLIQSRSRLLYLCHNLEGDLYRQQIERLPLIVRSVARQDGRKHAEFECREVAQADAVTTIATRDRNVLMGLAGNVPMLTVPPTFAYEPWEGNQREAPADDAPIRLAFMGNFGWWPNQSAIDWFLTRIWPQAPERLELHLFGRGSDRHTRRERVIGHGFVDEISSVWEVAHIMIQPIVVASGLNIKVAETAYNRRPMIATPAAVEGCMFEPDPAIVVADSADKWVTFLRGPGPAQLLGRRVSLANAARFAETHNGAQLAHFVEEAIGGFNLRHRDGTK